MAGFDDSQYDWRAVLAESGDLPESSPAEDETPNTDQEFSDAIFRRIPISSLSVAWVLKKRKIIRT